MLGFDDYLSKPIDPRSLEKMLIQYLPQEKIQSPTANQPVETSSNEKPAGYEYLNVELGLSYSGDMPDMYRSILEMFCNLKDGKQAALQKSFDEADWKNYTIQIHALKSTALSIGGEKTSELAKQLELAGKSITSADTSEQEKQQSLEFIKANHSAAMNLYDKLAENCEEYLKA